MKTNNLVRQDFANLVNVMLLDGGAFAGVSRFDRSDFAFCQKIKDWVSATFEPGELYEIEELQQAAQELSNLRPWRKKHGQ